MAHIIFDFDGTLADSLPILIDEYTRWSGNPKPLKPEEIAAMRNMTPAQVLKKLKLPIYKIPGLLVRGRDALRYRINEVDMFPGMDKVVRHLAGDGHKLYIMSSNSLVNIQAFLNRYKIADEFTDIKAGISVFGKAQQMKVFLKKHKVIKNKAYYIGDEIRDIEAAKRAKLPIISVTWGYNGAKIIAKHKPGFIAGKPADLLSIINRKENEGS